MELVSRRRSPPAPSPAGPRTRSYPFSSVSGFQGSRRPPLGARSLRALSLGARKYITHGEGPCQGLFKKFSRCRKRFAGLLTRLLRMCIVPGQSLVLIPTYVHCISACDPILRPTSPCRQQAHAKRRTPYLAPSASLLPSCQNGTVYPFSVPTARRTHYCHEYGGNYLYQVDNHKGSDGNSKRLHGAHVRYEHVLSQPQT